MNNLKKRAFSLFLICALLVAIAGVGNPDTTYAASKKTHLKKETISIVTGNAYQQKLIDKNGKIIKASRIKWKSRRKSIAWISKSGKVNAVKAGTVKMTAKYKGRTYRFSCA